ncbi:MAG: hypothetical protein KAI22_10320, partial [Gammaproteobacteria bacterium]|nr:hypothetical protein [Gammaproteobacteria bacterium]
MASKKVYKVSFKGIIFPGFDKDQVVENVYKITRIPKHIISRKFFSGKTVVIRHADSQEYASRLQKTFAQAGIETYINEVTGTVIEDELLVSDTIVIESVGTENESAKEHVETEKRHLTKKTFALIALLLFLAAILYFLNNNFINRVEDSNLQAEGSTQSSKQAITKDLLPAFLLDKQVKILIKITDKSALKRLSQFISLFDIEPIYLDIIKQAINVKDTAISISDEYPLYVFKIQEQGIETEGRKGILLSTKSKLPQTLISQFQKELDNNSKNKGSSYSCAKTPETNILNTNKHLLLTTIKDTQKLKRFNNLSKQKQLNTNLLQLDKLFHQNENAKNAAFNFFYLDSFPRNKNTKILKHSNQIVLSANSDSLWFSPGKSISAKNTELLKQFNINTHDTNKLSLLKTNNLFNLFLLVIAQNHADNFFSNIHTDPFFEQEKIIDIKKNYSVSDIKPYQNELD